MAVIRLRCTDTVNGFGILLHSNRQRLFDVEVRRNKTPDCSNLPKSLDFIEIILPPEDLSLRVQKDLWNIRRMRSEDI